MQYVKISFSFNKFEIIIAWAVLLTGQLKAPLCIAQNDFELFAFGGKGREFKTWVMQN